MFVTRVGLCTAGCMLCESGVDGLKRPDHHVDAFGTQCGNKMLNIFGLDPDSDDCTWEIVQHRKRCCGNEEPSKIAQAPTVAPATLIEHTGDHPSCDICYDFTFPGNPAMVINMLDVGVGSCRQFFEVGRAGFIVPHLCSTLQSFAYGPCGCGRMPVASSGGTEPTAPRVSPYPTPASTPGAPTLYPTRAPTLTPTRHPTSPPTKAPTLVPTAKPTPVPTPVPTAKPTPAPTEQLTPNPTRSPSKSPTQYPTPIPTQKPHPVFNTKPPTVPTPVPTEQPTPNPSRNPSKRPTLYPTPLPTLKPHPVFNTRPPTPSPTQPNEVNDETTTPANANPKVPDTDDRTGTSGRGGSGGVRGLQGK